MTGPQDWVTTGGLIVATAAGAAACAGAVRRVGRGDEAAGRIERAATGAMTLLCAAVFVYRLAAVHQKWAPLQSHVDGLALLGAMLGVAVIYLQWTRRLSGLAMFLLPAATLLTLWGVCASRWTFRPFDISGVWRTVHLMSVYLGTLGVAAAAGAGALWLYVDRQMRGKDHRGERLSRLGRLANLESVEHAMTGAAVAGFALLSVALVSGLVIVTGDDATKLGDGWWYSPKVVLAGAVWGIFAVVMNVRFVATFRGRRAAVLSIIGFVLIVAVLGIAQALPAVAARVSGFEFRVSSVDRSAGGVNSKPEARNPKPASTGGAPCT